MNEEKADKLVMDFYQSICNWYRQRDQYKLSRKASDWNLVEAVVKDIDNYRKELITALIAVPDFKKNTIKNKLKALFCFISGHDWT